jgi:prepilin peptidase CpaA
MTSIDPFWALTILIAALAAYTDMRTGRIPNRLTAFAFAAAIVGHAIDGSSQGGVAGAATALSWSVAGACTCAAPLALLYVRGAVGGGDLKLFAAIGAILHPMKGLEVEVYAFVVAVIVVTGQMVHRGALFTTLARAWAVVVAEARSTARSRRAEGVVAERTALPAPLLTWFRLGPSVLVGALSAWLLGHG